MADGTRPRVLVVDDERSYTDLLAEFFEQEGYRVDRAYDGEQALQLLQAGDPPDVVLSDVMLPKLKGTELVAEARSLYPADRLPIVLLSAGRDPGMCEDHVCFMAKPIDFDRLLRQVQRLTDGHPRGARATTAATASPAAPGRALSAPAPR